MPESVFIHVHKNRSGGNHPGVLNIRFLAGCQRLLCMLLLINCSQVFAQIKFSAILLNQSDSTPIPYATVKLVETDQYAGANENGQFGFSIPESLSIMHLEVSAIGCHTTIIHKRSGQAVTKLYVIKTITSIKEVVIQGFTAGSVLKKAISLIPENYTDTSYVSVSFFRQYQKVNGVFQNLLEAQLMVMLNLSHSKKELVAKEAFAVQQLRRSLADYKIKSDNGDDCDDLFLQNPIYHLSASSLNPAVLDDIKCTFDTLQLPDSYVINYLNESYSSENHGISNFSYQNYSGESLEFGRIIIDKSSFAIVKYERTTVRNKKYHYPLNNNFVLPDRKYTAEFIEGRLIVEFQPIKGKWYLKRILHAYTNEYYRTQTYSKEYKITNAFEWTSDSITRLIPEYLVNEFYFSPNLPYIKRKYNKDQWVKEIPAFFFCSPVDIYRDLSKRSNLESQFEKEGKPTR